MVNDTPITEKDLDLMDALKELERRGLIEWEMLEDDVRVWPTPAGIQARLEEAQRRGER